MDQVKEFLRQCIYYRFWISLSVAALFSIIAYFLGSCSVRAKAATETTAITSAESDFSSTNGVYQKNPKRKTNKINFAVFQ